MKVIFKNSSLKFEKAMSQVNLTPYETIATGSSMNVTTGNFNIATGGMPTKLFDVSQFAGKTIHIKTVRRYIHGTSSTIAFGVFYSTKKTSADTTNNVLTGGIGVLTTETSGLSFEAGYNGSNSNSVITGEISIPANAVSLALQADGETYIGVDTTNDLMAFYFD